MLTHKKELREVLTRLRDNKVTVDMATTIIEMIVGANMVAALARYGSPTLVHPNPPSKLESGHISEVVKTEQASRS